MDLGIDESTHLDIARVDLSASNMDERALSRYGVGAPIRCLVQAQSPFHRALK
jgi:hypothetical protein